MQIGILGLNHKSASLDLREKLTISALRRFGPDCSHHGELSYVLLTTCNRTEIYFSSSDLAYTHSYLLGILRAEINEEFEHTIYSYFGKDCFLHLAQVTCGVDSAVVGETEIQGQVKTAYSTAAQFRPLESQLHYLFQKCLKIGKSIRSMPLHTKTLEEIIVHLIYAHANVLFVGVSEINMKILRHLRSHMTIMNRTLEKAKKVADAYQIDYLPWGSPLNDFDVLIYGTRASSYLLEEIEPGNRLILDLSLPRNVDPALGMVKGVRLLNIDDLQGMVDKRQGILLSRLLQPLIYKAVDKQIDRFSNRERQSIVC